MRAYQDLHAASRIEGRDIDQAIHTDPSTWPKEWLEISFKEYERLAQVELPPAHTSLRADLLEAIRKRRSSRVPSEEPISLAALACLLGWSLGMQSGEGHAAPGARRHFPSAGARFPTECYVIARRCTELPEGLYHYHPLKHRLARIWETSMSDALESIFGHRWIVDSRAVLMLTAVMERTTVKYSERGYRFALMEVGHIMQNMCLLATAMGLPFTPVGGFADQPAVRLLNVGETNELPLYAGVLP